MRQSVTITIEGDMENIGRTIGVSYADLSRTFAAHVIFPLGGQEFLLVDLRYDSGVARAVFQELIRV